MSAQDNVALQAGHVVRITNDTTGCGGREGVVLLAKRHCPVLLQLDTGRAWFPPEDLEVVER